MPGVARLIAPRRVSPVRIARTCDSRPAGRVDAAFRPCRPSAGVPHCSGMAISGGIGGIRLPPAFTLPRADGGCVHSWDYKGRAALGIWLLAERPPSNPALVACVESYARLRDEEAELLVVQVGPP